ncbi:mechanosensitive ion channel family protein [Luteibaculum oceani]|uniref:Mechanosensitive ion channel n=1 Tax=Luteibaculum oceani TaxID=1294296 RepID=A0A5C6USI5_9FLAO|nr:mechanosensitive ion channel domain-containing protein [Luteibaculum oceani]TXC76207.1 mechanosensitive ion channel [Luteibaculum oceani]
METVTNWINDLKPLIVSYGTKILVAIIILWVGLKVAKMITKGFSKTLDKQDVAPSLKPFLTSVVSTLLKVLVFVSVLGTLGIEMTSFAAIIAAAGLAVGMALSGTLQNFAGGVIILLLKPFKVGDVIQAQGFMGTVSEIQVFYTLIKTFDNQVIILPNGKLSNESITNYSREETRRMVLTAGIGYDDDIDKAKKVLMDILTSEPRILKDPSPQVYVSELGDSSVNFTIKAWANSGDFWAVHYEMYEKIKKEFDANKIEMPYPQRDIHLFKES